MHFIFSWSEQWIQVPSTIEQNMGDVDGGPVVPNSAGWQGATGK
jgi:hypothetical protein